MYYEHKYLLVKLFWHIKYYKKDQIYEQTFAGPSSEFAASFCPVLAVLTAPHSLDVKVNLLDRYIDVDYKLS